MAIDKDELKEILKESLSVSVSAYHKSGWYGDSDSVEITTTIYFDNEELSTYTDSFSLPSKS